MAIDLKGLTAPLLTHLPNRRYVLGIVGPPGSGKSTLAANLASFLNSPDQPHLAQAIGIDGFHMSNELLRQRGLRAVKGAQQTFEVAELIVLLKQVREAATAVSAPQYCRSLHEPVPNSITIPPETQLVIVEGNYLLLDGPPWDAVAPLLDEVWYLDVAEALCMERVKQRHLLGGCDLATAEQKIEENDRVNFATVAQTKTRANRVISPAN